MSCRPIIRDLQYRDLVICRTCLSHLARQPRPWVAPFSSQTSIRDKKQKTSEERAAPRPARAEAARSELARSLQKIRAEQTPTTEKPGNFSVRYFEQDDNNRRELDGEQAFEESFSRLEAPELRGGLSDFQAGLRTADEKDAFQSVVAEIGEEWSHVRTAEDMERMIAKLKRYTQSIDKEIEETAADMPRELVSELLSDDVTDSPSQSASSGRRFIARPQIPEDEDWTVSQRLRVKKLNVTLSRTASSMNRDQTLSVPALQALWKSYQATRITLSYRWSCVPLDVWDFLWEAFSTTEARNRYRFPHIAQLAQDMGDARVTFTPPQQLLTIEALFVTGWEAKALDNWRRCVTTLGAPASATFQAFWELGVRMHCLVGDAAQAEHAADQLLPHKASPRILLPLLRLRCEQATPTSADEAWATYSRMRSLLGAGMRLTDYDAAVALFLAADQVENALNAFVDMMSDGRINLRDQPYLPSVIANKFFFGKWLKRLIGAGNLDGAHRVIEYMQDRHIEGASVQVNGLVGAWLRSGGSSDVGRADALAWRMIQAQIRFAGDRRRALAQGHSYCRPPTTGLPRATLETFYLLADNYRQRGLHARLRALWEAFRDAELRPDAFMMNQLLESHLATNEPRQALALFRDLVAIGVAPDAHSFSALWKSLDINRLHFVPRDSLPPATAAARALFRDMLRHQRVFVEDESGAKVDGQLARKILHSFRRLRDHAGSVVALAALRHVFGFALPETLVLELLVGTSRLSWDSPAHRRKLMLAKRSLDHAIGGGDADQPSDHRSDALYRHLHNKHWSELGDVDKGDVLVAAAREMGVDEVLPLETYLGEVPGQCT